MCRWQCLSLRGAVYKTYVSTRSRTERNAPPSKATLNPICCSLSNLPVPSQVSVLNMPHLASWANRVCHLLSQNQCLAVEDGSVGTLRERWRTWRKHRRSLFLTLKRDPRRYLKEDLAKSGKWLPIPKIPVASYGQTYVAVYTVQKKQVFGNHPESRVAPTTCLHNILRRIYELLTWQHVYPHMFCMQGLYIAMYVVCLGSNAKVPLQCPIMSSSLSPSAGSCLVCWRVIATVTVLHRSGSARGYDWIHAGTCQHIANRPVTTRCTNWEPKVAHRPVRQTRESCKRTHTGA